MFAMPEKTGNSQNLPLDIWNAPFPLRVSKLLPKPPSSVLAEKRPRRSLSLISVSFFHLLISISLTASWTTYWGSCWLKSMTAFAASVPSYGAAVIRGKVTNLSLNLLSIWKSFNFIFFILSCGESVIRSICHVLWSFCFPLKTNLEEISPLTSFFAIRSACPGGRNFFSSSTVVTRLPRISSNGSLKSAIEPNRSMSTAPDFPWNLFKRRFHVSCFLVLPLNSKEEEREAAGSSLQKNSEFPLGKYGNISLKFVRRVPFIFSAGSLKSA